MTKNGNNLSPLHLHIVFGYQWANLDRFQWKRAYYETKVTAFWGTWVHISDQLQNIINIWCFFDDIHSDWQDVISYSLLSLPSNKTSLWKAGFIFYEEFFKARTGRQTMKISLSQITGKGSSQFQWGISLVWNAIDQVTRAWQQCFTQIGNKYVLKFVPQCWENMF